MALSQTKSYFQWTKIALVNAGVLLVLSPSIFLPLPSLAQNTSRACKFQVPQGKQFTNLGKVAQKTGERGKDYNADAYRAKDGRFVYVVKTLSDKPVGIATVQYSRQRNRNVATITVCANAQSSSLWAVLAFTFGNQRVSLPILGKQSKVIYPTGRSHTVTVQTVVDAS